MKQKALIFCTLLMVAALPAVAAPGSFVPAGVDYWQTLASGATAYNFAANPIPAGFFCPGSPAFRGRINFEGVPLRTEPAGILGTTDTIIERLDDAYFDAKGRAETRIRGRALNLQGTETLKTICGELKVTANLADDQPVSRMTLQRDSPEGGTFDAQLRLRVKINFTHLRSGRTSSVVHTVDLPTVNRIPFALGVIAQQRCIQVGTVDNAAVTLLSDRRPVLERRNRPGLNSRLASTSEKVILSESEHEPVPSEEYEPAYIVTGCYCQNGVCLNTYSWHDPCATNPNCEQHWTASPCQLGYQQFCDVFQQHNFERQLEDLHERGYITDTPEVALRKHLRSAEEIQKDQTARDKAARDRSRQ